MKLPEIDELNLNYMKKLFTLIALLAINFTLFSQAPQKLSYQAVIRNTSGTLVANHAVGMKISILQGTATGTAVYVETHTPTTNANGLATIEIGGGSIVSGTFSAINWTSGSYFLKTETDPSGGSSYSIVGTSQLLSVPYALDAKTSESVIDNSITSAKIFDGTIATADLGNNSVISAKITDATIAAADLAANAVTTEKINSGAVTGAKIAQAGATSGQALKWNGTIWTPANDETGDSGLTLPFSGSASTDGATFQIINTFPNGPFENQLIGIKGKSNASYGTGVYGEVLWDGGPSRGVYGKVNSVEGIGVLGQNDRTLGSGSGVRGESASKEGGKGVYGYASNSEGENYGIYGKSESYNGYGVYGVAQRLAVHGSSTGTSGIAVKGEATGTASIGVQGFALNSSSIGVFGKASVQGVYGEASSSTGRGLYGYATSETGATCGIYAESKSVAGYGVYGKAPAYGVYGIVTSVTGNTYGVYGISSSDNGRGVKGEATATTGYADGVYGSSEANNGSGVYGIALHTSGINNGGYFKSLSSSGYGVYSESLKFGVYGKSSSSTGRAVMGEAMGTGSIGVYGKALADNCTGVWGEGSKYDFLANGPGIDYGTGSSIRWKNNIILIPDPLGKIAAIRGVFFNWDETHGGKRDIGMIAEEVGKVLPEIVAYEENGVDAYGMDYSKITPLLIEAIKAQQIEIESLKARLEKMEEKIGK